MSTQAPSWPAAFSPHSYWAHVGDQPVQQALRAAFVRWGLPRAVRVGNGKPWGGWSDLPPALALWLIGLGVEVLWNDPCCPQQNGVVERSQGTSKRWAEPHKCGSPEQLQQRLDEDDLLQRERYPQAQGKSRWQLYPELRHSGRAYREEDEEGMWSLELVREHLAGYALARQVCRAGKISVYNRSLYVGTLHAGQRVWLQYDPQQGCWLISDDEGRQIRTQAAAEINAAAIRQLQLKGNK
jgi:hypothetical protein